MILNSLACSELERLLNNENLFNPRNPYCLIVCKFFSKQKDEKWWEFYLKWKMCSCRQKLTKPLSNIVAFSWIWAAVWEAHISHMVQPVYPLRFKSKAGGDSASFMVESDINIGQSLKALWDHFSLLFWFIGSIGIITICRELHFTDSV